MFYKFQLTQRSPGNEKTLFLQKIYASLTNLIFKRSGIWLLLMPFRADGFKTSVLL